MKTVYFIRHAQTESNALEIRGTRTDRLSELGRQQAQAVADRLKGTGIQVVISSPYTRTQHTAEAIAGSLGTGVELEPLFEELKSPSVIEGVSRKDPDAIRIRQEIWDRMEDPQWHYSNEENFHDVKARAARALKLLESREEGVLAVVTHAGFLRAIARTIIMREEYSPASFKAGYEAFLLSNTGVTVCVLDDRHGWQLARWNDTVHLAPDMDTWA